MPSPELAPILAALRARGSSRDGLSVEEKRAGYERLARLFPVAPEVQVEPVEVAGVAGEWITAGGGAAERTVLYLHGGAYVIGSCVSHRDLASRVGRAAGARVLSLAYRLAPEHPFPAAVEDAVAAYRGLLAAGTDPRRLALAGDSAGGGLALAVMLAAREAGDPLPAAAVCLSPWVDLEGLGESMIRRADQDPLIQRDELLRMARLYLAGASPRHPLAAPLHADLAGLPPLLIQVGEAETLLDDSRRLADKARAAGVDARLEVWPGMFHGWQLFARLLPEGRQAIDAIGAFLHQRVV